MSDTAASATPAPPSPPVPPTTATTWAHAAAYDHPLPPTLLDTDYTSYTKLTERLSALSSQLLDITSGIEVCPVIATYKDKKHKDNCIKSLDPEVDDVNEYKAGATISSATKAWRKTRPTIGLVCSSISPASVARAEGNEWHMVVLATHNNTIFIHDPNFNFATHAGSVRSFKDVPMNSTTIPMVKSHFTQATEVWLQGPPSGFDRSAGECMGRSLQWLEATVSGQLPWPPNATAAGGQWHKFWMN